MLDDVLAQNPWQTEESQYPYMGSLADKLRFLLNYAVLAPSIHNTQPWLFSVEGDVLEVCADRSRAVPAVDPTGRELTISCGAALMNLVAAMRHFGNEGWIQYLPQEQVQPDLLARVRLGRVRSSDYQDESLFRAIRRRRTTRLPFQQRLIPRALQRRLIWLASEYSSWLHFVESPSDRSRVNELVGEGDRRQLGDRAFRQELADWIHPREGNRADGMSAYALGLAPLLDFSTPLIATAVRTFDLGRGRAARDQSLLEHSPVLVVLGTSGDTPYDWLNAGQAMEQMLLRAASEDVTASYLNQPIELPDLREELRKITGRSGFPQLLIRLGYAPRRDPSPRRTVREVLLNDVDLTNTATLDMDNVVG